MATRTCPLEGCGRTFSAKGGAQYLHWQHQHNNAIEWPAYKNLPLAPVNPDGGSPGEQREPSKPITPRQPSPPPPRLETLQTPEEVFKGIGLNLGISEITARSVAFYVTENYALDNAEKVSEALAECTTLTPNQRTQWWKTWVNRQRLPLSLEFAARVLKQSPETGAGAQGEAKAPSTPTRPDRRYLVDDDTGEMHLVTPESEDYHQAFTFWEARTHAKDVFTRSLQERHGQGRKFYVIGSQVYPVGEGEEGFSYAEAAGQAQANWDKEMERERQAGERERIQAPAAGDQQSLMASFITPLVTALTERRDGGSELMEARLREVQTRVDSQIELQRVQGQHQQESLATAIASLGEKITQGRRDPEDPVASLIKLIDLENTLRAQLSGEPTDEAGWRRDFLKVLRKELPDFISAGREVAEATKMQLAARQQESERIMGACPSCGVKIRYPVTAKLVRCGACGHEFPPGEALPPREKPNLTPLEAQAPERPKE